MPEDWCAPWACDGMKTPNIIKPNSGITHLQWLLHELDTSLSQNPRNALQDVEFPNLPSLLTNRSLVFLISDFAFLDQNTEILPLLTRLSPKHEVYSMLLVDPIEEELSYKHGWLPLCDEATRTVVWINTADRWLIREYRQQKNGSNFPYGANFTKYQRMKIHWILLCNW